MPIVAAVDRSDRATRVVERAASLADAYNTSVCVVYVLKSSEFHELEQTSYDRTGKSPSADDVRDAARSVADEKGGTVLQEYEAIGRVGDPSTEILREADERDAPYVVIGGRKRSRVGKAIFGSVAQSLLLNSDRAIVVEPVES